MNKLKLAVLLIIILCSNLMSQANIPASPESWVSDYAGVLSDSEKAFLIDILSRLEKRSSNQIYIALFNKLPQDFYLEDFAVKLFDTWHPGLEKQDNGLLIIAFIQDRKIRIEVGYGLEDVVTDAQAAVLIRQYITPEFRNGNYFQGLKAALEVLIPAVEGKYKIPIESPSEEGNYFGLIYFILILFFIFFRFRSRNNPAGIGSKNREAYSSIPFIWGGFSGSGSRSSGGGGFSGGFGGMSGGGGASGSW